MHTRSRTALIVLALAGAAAAVTCGGIAVIDHDTSSGSSAGGGSGNSSSSSSVSSSASGYSCDQCKSSDVLGQIDTPAIIEASGLAASRVHDDVYYVHNDSGDVPVVYVINGLGQLQSLFVVDASTNVDWEDIAVGKCPAEVPGDSCVFVADIGDNPETRTGYQLYIFPEPDPLLPKMLIPPFRFDYVYPDGSHNAETLLVSEQGVPVIVTKVSSGSSQIFHLPNMVLQALNQAELAGELAPPLGLAMFTGGDAHAQGVLMRTYSHLFYYPPAADLPTALSGQPCPMPALAEPQGEAVSWYADGSGFLTVSEGSLVPLHHYQCSQ